MLGNLTRVALVVFHASALTLGCSDDDPEERTESGSCNAIVAISECSEVEGSPDGVMYEREACEEIGDTWTTEPCPTANLLGCCVFEFAGDVFRDCYYVGHVDPVTAHEETCLVDSQGEWRPGSR
jgi:hypothetical protein